MGSCGFWTCCSKNEIIPQSFKIGGDESDLALVFAEKERCLVSNSYTVKAINLESKAECEPTILSKELFMLFKKVIRQDSSQPHQINNFLEKIVGVLSALKMVCFIAKYFLDKEKELNLKPYEIKALENQYSRTKNAEARIIAQTLTTYGFGAVAKEFKQAAGPTPVIQQRAAPTPVIQH